jgi:hypothetical protein
MDQSPKTVAFLMTAALVRAEQNEYFYFFAHRSSKTITLIGEGNRRLRELRFSLLATL